MRSSILKLLSSRLSGAYGTRTRVTDVRGRRPRPLDECAQLTRAGFAQECRLWLRACSAKDNNMQWQANLQAKMGMVCGNC